MSQGQPSPERATDALGRLRGASTEVAELLKTETHPLVRQELERLVQVERPRVVAIPNEIERKLLLQSLDQRIRQLEQSLESAIVVPPPTVLDDTVRFGATVTVRESSGAPVRYRIVGVDEADSDRDWVSWLSPIARALLKARIGQRIRFKFPAGEKELEIAGITYE